MIIYNKQKKFQFFLVFAVSICIFSSNIFAQEARPTDIRPPETATTAKITPEESERRLQDAKLLFDRGKTDAAIYMLQQLEKTDPTNYKVLFKLGEMAIADRNWAYSIEVLRKASFLRLEDIDVRLILMNVYKAYQMPIQEIVVGKEILALDPKHIVAAKRLAELYMEQAMWEDEIKIRQKLKRLVTDDYQNLKRLADIYDKNGELWEAARIYEQIRKFHPTKTDDMTRLAAIYDELKENFREIQVLDQIKKKGDYSWLKGRAIKNIRLQSKIYDPFNARLTFRKDNNEEIDQFTTTANAKYLRIRLQSSIDVGVETKLTQLHHTGREVLDGDMDINSGTIAFKAVKNWKDKDYTLAVKVGLLWDEISGRLRPRDPTSGTTAADFPFLKHPSFNAYGGMMPVGGIKFTAKPGLRATYQIAYEHGQVEDLDARLRMFYFDKATLSYSYLANDNTKILLQMDESAISDGNFRFHGLASVSYTLWGSSPMHNYRDALGIPIWRNDFLRKPLHNFLKVGYKYEYFNDRRKSVNYETYKTEDRHLYQMEAQARLCKLGLDKNLFINCNLGYSNGSTLDLQRQGGAQLFYRDSDSGNEIGLSYAYEWIEEENVSAGNARISGNSRSNTFFAFIKWRF